MIIPQNFRQPTLHSFHTGIAKIKSMPGAYVRWPKLDAQIEQTYQNCKTCAVFANNPLKTSFST